MLIEVEKFVCNCEMRNSQRAYFEIPQDFKLKQLAESNHWQYQRGGGNPGKNGVKKTQVEKS